jgi:hypothetical protein
MPTTISPEQILRELAELWISLGKPAQEAASTGVLRACTMSLVVLADDAEEASGIWENIAALMPEHPSRAILVRCSAGSEREVSARVFAQCWMPFGERRQICCEQVEISASDAVLPDLPPLLLPLVVPDLPVVVWCRSARLFAMREFGRAAAEMAQKVIVDSAGMAFEAVAAAHREGLPVADLSWTRVTRWREVVARVFDNPAYLERLAAVSGLRIAFTGSAPPSSAWYLAAWLLEGLRGAGSLAEPRFERVPGEEPGGLQGVALEGPGVEVSIKMRSSGCAEIRTGEVVQQTAFPRPTDYLLMREELAIPARDPVFASVVPEAARLAREFQA